ncbi:MAG: PglZ domain protein [halophilic archaeon J07HX64]|jgi:Sulfatase.|nr:MAG: PglZ domain protein [halophilic archaeon J07HX64]
MKGFFSDPENLLTETNAKPEITMFDIAAPAASIARNLRHRGFGAVHEFASMVRYSVGSTTTPDPVLTANWDVLVVLDACRADLFREVVVDGGYELPDGRFDTRMSPASASTGWLDTVFGAATDAQLADLVYVTGNPYSASMVEDTRFQAVEEVWRDSWDDDAGTIPARPVTDAAVRAGRRQEPARLVVHYMQPHFPALGDSNRANGVTSESEHNSRSRGVTLSEFGDRGMSVWEDLRLGRWTVEGAWEAYRANLVYVLEEVTALLSNLDAGTVVLTADHGNAFGEHAVYGHPGGVDLPCLREVPWYETTATDTHSRETRSRESTGKQTGDVVEQRLRDLGYKQ